MTAWVDGSELRRLGEITFVALTAAGAVEGGETALGIDGFLLGGPCDVDDGSREGRRDAGRDVGHEITGGAASEGEMGGEL